MIETTCVSEFFYLMTFLMDSFPLSSSDQLELFEYSSLLMKEVQKFLFVALEEFA